MAKFTELDTCGCCEAEVDEPQHENRPGQSALNFRIGTHSSFLRRMVLRLGRQEIPSGEQVGELPLARLTTRATDDPAIALMDAWATASDVLAFYQERIANEGYLQTATERRSVLELARAISYELNPGVAASTFLVFDVDASEQTPSEVTIEAGTQIQSIPLVAGELPQTFETSETFLARAKWNKLGLRLARPQILTVDATTVYLKGTNTNLQVGELLLLVVESQDGTRRTGPRRMLSVETDVPQNRTKVVLEAEVSDGSAGGQEALAIDTDGGSGSTFSVDASGGSGADFGTEAVAFTTSNVESLIGLNLNEADFQSYVLQYDWNLPDVEVVVNNIIQQSFDAPNLGDAEVGVFALRQKAGFFGHNAPRWGTLPVPENTRAGADATVVDPYASNWDAGSGRTIWVDSQGVPYADAHVFLERSVPDILVNSWVVFETRDATSITRQTFGVSTVSEVSLADYALNAKATGLGLTLPDGETEPDIDATVFFTRRTTAYVQSERLELAPLPIEEPLDEATIAAGTTELTLDGIVSDLQAGQALALTGERSDAEKIINTEILILKDVQHSDEGHTVLDFTTGLQHNYYLQSVTLSANVVRATHGETQAAEVLGGGDGSLTNQRFMLNKPPLTYVSASTANGIASTLQVRVNGLLWEERPSLFNLDANSESYIVRLDNDGQTSVIFGDGISGARLPTGQENVTATYRSGIGAEGEVAAHSLTLLKTRPLGVSSVTNPLDASDSANPESLENARTNAPLTVLTLDRIVSLKDFENFANAFAGIGKAQAVSLFNGETALVHITILGEGGSAIEETSDLFQNLQRAVNDARDPTAEVQIDSGSLLWFNLAASVQYDSRFLADDVEARIKTALVDAFSFDKREFGQPATAAEVIAMIQAVRGVTAVDLDELFVFTEETGLASVLPARIARRAGDNVFAAELLLVTPHGINLTMKASLESSQTQ